MQIFLDRVCTERVSLDHCFCCESSCVSVDSALMQIACCTLHNGTAFPQCASFDESEVYLDVQNVACNNHTQMDVHLYVFGDESEGNASAQILPGRSHTDMVSVQCVTACEFLVCLYEQIALDKDHIETASLLCVSVGEFQGYTSAQTACHKNHRIAAPQGGWTPFVESVPHGYSCLHLTGFLDIWLL